MKPNLLVIDDNTAFLEELQVLLAEDFNVKTTTDTSVGLRMITETNPDLILLDLMLDKGENGIDVLQKIQSIDSTLPVIIITEHGSIDTAVKAMRMGAVNYISKTTKMEELKVLAQKAMDLRVQAVRSKILYEEAAKNFNLIVGSSESTMSLLKTIDLVATSDVSVLITGESGTGKELVARQIHQKSNRSKEVFMSLNCSAIPKDLIESELFGHEKGAFTGASTRKIGKFEAASKGILFFDEIGELNLESQVKLLRALQEKEFSRVGSNTNIKTDVRVLAATNSDLEKMIKNGQFRDDLFYRLDVLRINVPPLRDRLDDIPDLTKYFTELICRDMKIPVKTITNSFIDKLKNYNWPGNIRELRNYITRAIIYSPEGEIKASDLSNVNSINKTDKGSTKIPKTIQELKKLRNEAAETAKREVERQFLTALLEKYDGNISQAAQACGINRTNLHKMITRADISERNM